MRQKARCEYWRRATLPNDRSRIRVMRASIRDHNQTIDRIFRDSLISFLAVESKYLNCPAARV